jgi:hypothetical protein
LPIIYHPSSPNIREFPHFLVSFPPYNKSYNLPTP